MIITMATVDNIPRQNDDSLSVSTDSTHLNGQTEHLQNIVAVDNWGFTLDELYKHALHFYKDKEGTKALQISYTDRLKLAALTKQVSYGKFRSDVSPDVGLLDRIGNDRRQVWQSLGDMSRDDAMKCFITTLVNTCPLFTPYIEAHQTERQQLLLKRQQEEDEMRREEELEQERKQQQARDELETEKALQLEQQIRSALVQQTEIHFRQYAKQQVPDNEQQQEELVAQLQEQHYEQYMQHVHSQLVLHQRQQYAQLLALKHGVQLAPIEPADDRQVVEYQTEGASTHESVDEGRGSLMEAVDEGRVCVEEAGLENGVNTLTLQDNVNETPLLPVDPTGVSGVVQGDVFRVQHRIPAGREGETGVEDDDSDTDDIDTDVYSMESLPTLIPALLWTRKDIREFKDSVRKNPENVLRVSSLSTATVRVPTHHKGCSVFWEFATDNYDLGFGVYFEWNLEPPTQIQVQVSESSDEEDIEEEFAEGSPEVSTKGDIEKGSHNKKDTGPPTDEIIQVYRRDCHEEVYCGSHAYPGRGVYLLKFDNSYSLWRSKTVYYRVFYSK